MTHNKINFGIMLHGAGGHMNSWRHPSVPADASVNIAYNVNLAKRAEAEGLAFVFVADGLYINEKSIPHFLNRFEPLTLLSFLAAHTSKIGLGGTVSTSYSDPFTVARQFASLDLLSGGRAAWNIVTTPLEGTAKNYGRPHPDHTLRYEIASEYIDVVKGLWSSWEEDAFVRNRETGQFFDPKKMHRVNHHGKFFSVEGPLNIQRSLQGEPVIFQAGASESGIHFASKYAEAVFTHIRDIDEARNYAKRIRDGAVAHGRSLNDVKIFPGISPIVGRTKEEAEEKFREIRNLVNIEDALAYLGRYFDHHDFAQYDLDKPFPEIGDIGKNSFRSTSDHIKQEAKEKGLTLREVALKVTTQRGDFIGSYDDVTNRIIEWFDSGAADGFILTMQVSGQGFDDFSAEILPRLEERGYFDRKLHHNTLRENLGLAIPSNRYAEKQQIVAA
ncbi:MULTISPECIES: LLM class flavin-dependent oxidoreductase [Bartonella]|uniref:LLM class flavin-dependent oxidoreductase n=1 Tax=Bartonella TaxID=773 RepID=UPI0018DEA46D|nr:MULTISPECIES: LLM class flavin-dependent oxidoreductase [Bartonella]MBH9993779.1 LLM class flavin-dependent oxidoreductase [Bartonella sp. P0291]MBH9997875.1 LLM class flavin-dependent oxidoreductase [Bartonella sp. M0192]MBI0000034.1 LLM class flavin-dependent oxidoreductase [Bartonella sp. M0191]MBI0007597.1 LLM class flavin-dependent oxidoreductase [Bartonella sp. M0193]MBI0011325.1 LLM class flavin-dependent oxidoreductase [Bartonella sp. M0176]